MSGPSPSRVREVLETALDAPPPERDAHLDKLCGHDGVLRTEVESLIRAHEQAGGFLDIPAAPKPAPAGAVPVPGSGRSTSLSGRVIGPYTVGQRVGAGGMGVVYQAQDTRLGRAVALKVLPDSLAHDPDRRARLEREARSLASLSHPNIAAIYSLEELEGGSGVGGGAGAWALVLEFVPGQTLAERIACGPLATDEALGIARQVANGLEAAHGGGGMGSRGIVHRDLKPSNIKITPEGTVKILDFGIAKAAGTESVPGSGSDPLATRPGTLVGTAAYMSPEQARGRAVDKRADLWAFGCVLYEMLTGHRAFPGDTTSDTVAAILRGEPDWTVLPTGVPPGALRVLHRCLEKDPERRMRDAGDARLELEDPTQSPDLPPDVVRGPRGWIRYGVAGAGLLGLGAALALVFRPAPQSAAPKPAPAWRYAIDLDTAAPPTPPGTGVSNLAVSPDGLTIAFTAGAFDRALVYVRRADQVTATALPGTDGASSLCFSPDGRWIAFVDNEQVLIKKVAVTGGTPVLIASESVGATSPVWLKDGTIVFSRLFNPGLQRIFVSSGRIEHIDTYRVEPLENAVMATDVLPDGRTLLTTAILHDPTGIVSRVEAFDPTNGRRTVLVEHARSGMFVPPALVFWRDGVLTGAPFNADRLAVTGDTVTLEDRVCGYEWLGDVLAAGPVGGEGVRGDARSTLAMVHGPVRREAAELCSIALDGTATVLATATMGFGDPRVSPDGTRIAVCAFGQSSDLWIYNLTRAGLAPVQLTHDLGCTYPVWSPDGRRIAFVASPAPGAINLCVTDADGAGPVRTLYRGSNVLRLSSWAPDGRTIAFAESSMGPPRGQHIKFLDPTAAPVDGGSLPTRPMLSSGASDYGAAFSPDGHWVAFTMDEGGAQAVFLASWSPDPAGGGGQLGPRTRVSLGGGYRATWAPDGARLYYQWGDQMWAVDFSAGGGGAGGPGGTATAPRLGEPVKLFQGRFFTRYDLHPDGKRFIAPRDSGNDTPARRIEVVVNWGEQVQRLMGAR
jgi:serine/threonine protein kinase/Tol biopolymer transport system component